MKINKSILGFILGLLIVPLLALNLISDGTPRTAYADLQQLFDQFEGKKELQTQLLRLSNTQRIQLDSLNLQLKALEKHLQANQQNESIATVFQDRSQQLFQLSQQYEQDYIEKSERFTQAVWQQINQYVKEYGAENELDYIYGTGGDGTIMYARPANDRTQQILEYINQRYEDL